MVQYLTRIAVLLTAFSASAQTTVTGTVVDEAGKPIGAVRVRVTPVPSTGVPQSDPEFIVTGADGTFSIDADVTAGKQFYLGVGKTRFVNVSGLIKAKAGTTPLGKVTLEGVSPIDNVSYSWVKPYVDKKDQTDLGCNFCHGKQHEAWKGSKMAISAKDPLVLSYYEGKDLAGAPAGDGWRVDHPDEAGPCANCHAPAAAANAPGKTVLSEVTGTAKEGVFCDICHKVRDVLPGAGPGVGGSLVLTRPSAWTGLFAFGPFNDAFGMPMTTSYNETITKARMCAGCHEWQNDQGVPVLSTFSEWSEMSGADPAALQCQDCHMKKKFGDGYTGEPKPTLGYILDDQMQQGMPGVKRWSDSVFPHVFTGGEDLAYEAAKVTLDLAQDGGDLVATIAVKNVNAGHALPTGMPFRNMILVVDADVGGVKLTQTGGPVVPDYGGEGTAPEDLAGKPGKGYARVLGDGKGGRMTPFWRATEVLEDTRIRAAETDEVELRFAVPQAGGKAHVTAALVYRRGYRPMVLEKKWDVEDAAIGGAARELDLSAPPPPEQDAGTVPPAAEPAAAVAPERTDGCAATPTGAPSALAPLALLLALVALRRRAGG